MKKRLGLMMAALVLLLLATGAAIGAETASQDEIRVFVDGEQLIFDVKPLATSERVLAPMRVVLEGLGYTLDYDEDTMTARGTSASGVSIEHVIGTSAVLVNGEAQNMEVASLATNGRTLVPLRFFSEILGYDVKWVQEDNAAYIKTGAPVGENGAKYLASYYFPMAMGNSWDLSNGGFEGCGYKMSVLIDSNPYFQCWTEVPGMSADIVVYDCQPDTVKIIFSEYDAGEQRLSLWEDVDLVHQEGFTSNKNEIVLQGPIIPGNEWTDDHHVNTIVSVDETVTTPAGSFSGCVKVERVASSSDTVVFDYYAPGIGWVKRDYTIDGAASMESSLLEAYTVN